MITTKNYDFPLFDIDKIKKAIEVFKKNDRKNNLKYFRPDKFVYYNFDTFQIEASNSINSLEIYCPTYYPSITEFSYEDYINKQMEHFYELIIDYENIINIILKNKYPISFFSFDDIVGTLIDEDRIYLNYPENSLIISDIINYVIDNNDNDYNTIEFIIKLCYLTGFYFNLNNYFDVVKILDCLCSKFSKSIIFKFIKFENFIFIDSGNYKDLINIKNYILNLDSSTIKEYLIEKYLELIRSFLRDTDLNKFKKFFLKNKLYINKKDLI